MTPVIEKYESRILQCALEGSAVDVAREMRCRSLYSNYYFVKVILGYRELVQRLHMVEMHAFLDRWADGNLKQWIEWSRGFFKTTSFTIGTSMWIVLPVNENDHDYAIYKMHIPEELWFRRVGLHDQDTTQLIAMETDKNAQKKVGIIRLHFEQNELFRSLFPEIAYNGTEPKWSNDCLIIRRKEKRLYEAEGTFEPIGVGNALQSRHYAIVWEDDLVGEKARKSEVVMADTIGWHGRLAGAFEKGARQIRFGVSNRWGLNDLNSYVRENEPDFFFHTRSAWEINPDTGEDEAIFPEQYSMDALFKIRDSGSMSRYDFSCQYLNNPVLPGEEEMEPGLIHSYEVVDGYIKCSCGIKVHPRQLLRFLHYDPYNAKKTSSSCPAIIVAGTWSDRHAFVLECFQGKGAYGRVFDKIFEFNDRWDVHNFTYEDVGHQNLTEHHIRKLESMGEHLKAHRRFRRITPVPTHNKAKEIRIREGIITAARFTNKLSIHKRHATLLKMFETFPNPVLTHDYDALDALNHGCMRDTADRIVWTYPTTTEQETVKKEEEEIIAKIGMPYGWGIPFHPAEVPRAS